MADFKSVSLADQVFEKLEADIITGVYPRGEILTELRLVEQLGVSRTPIREALRRLEHERLIEESGKGSVVLGITMEDLVDIMDIRQRVEGLAVFYATESITPEGLEKLQRIYELQEFYSSKHDLERIRQYDDQFHDTIYMLSGRPVLRDTLIPLHRKSRRYRMISIESKERVFCSLEEHRMILEAISAGDAKLAEQRVVTHVANAKENMIVRCYQHG